MSTEMQTRVQASPAQSFTPVQTGLLQKKCTLCNTPGLGEDSERDEEKLTLQRSSVDKAGTTTVPRFGHDFRKVRIHDAVPITIQTKLSISQPNDIYELEADRIADQVLAAPVHTGVSGAPPRIQRFSGQSNGQMDTAPASVDRVLANPGRPLEPALRQDNEQRFGHDFSRVRVHSGEDAEKSAQEVNAHAYTVGQNIVFGAGQFASETHEGRRLIAHELTHMVQQSGRHSSDPSTILRKADTSMADDISTALLGKLKSEHDGSEGKLPLTPKVLRWVTALRSGEGKPTEEDPESALAKNDPSKYPERRHEGEAFVWSKNDPRTIDPSDVRQGYLGDCYFMALLAAIAEVRPEAIEQMVKPNDDGSFTVSFFGPDGKRIQQIVEPTFPTHRWGDPAYAHFGDQSEVYGKELWPMLIEKAWMQANGSWLGIEGSKVDTQKHAIAMTSSEREYFPLPGKLSEEALFDRLSQHFRAKQPVTVFSHKGTEESKKKSLKTGVITNHAYALWNVHPASKTADLYNPHGPQSRHLLAKTMVFLRFNFRSIMFFKLKEAGLSTTKKGPTKEEQLGSEAVPKQILKDSGYDLVVEEFEKKLPTMTTQFTARDAVQEFGEKLWEQSKIYAQDPKNANTDDRPLYWARLVAATFLRSFKPSSFKLTPMEKQILLDVLEATSRGRTGIDFPAATPGGARRILVSGFDPFGLRSEGLRKANPSGSAVLALDGQLKV
jgi:hypothetical protein